MCCRYSGGLSGCQRPRSLSEASAGNCRSLISAAIDLNTILEVVNPRLTHSPSLNNDSDNSYFRAVVSGTIITLLPL